MIELPSAFVTESDNLPFADNWANTPGVRLKLLALRAQGKPVPANLPIGGAMRYRGLSL